MDTTDRWKRHVKKLPADERKRDIMLVAARLFHESGYHNTSMNDVAKAAGIAKPTLYHYFRSKEEILSLVLHEWVVVLSERHDNRVHAGTGPSELIEGVISDIFELMAVYRGHVAAFFESYRDLAAQDQRDLRDQRLIYRAKIEDAFLRGIKIGEFREIDVKLATLALFGMCNWGYRWFAPDGPQSPKRIAEVFWSLLRDGIGAAAIP